MSVVTRARGAALAALAVATLLAPVLSTAPASALAAPTPDQPAGGATTAAATTTPVTTLFRDFFSNPVDPAWTFYNRSGEIRAGRLWIDGGYLPASTDRDGWALTHVGDTSWTNYSLSASYDTTNAGGSPADAPSAMFFVRNQAQAPGEAVGTTYRIMVFDVGAGNPTPECGPSGPLAHGMTQIFKYVDGAIAASVTRCTSGSVTGTNLALITADGPTITVRINGVRVLRYVDPAPLTYGGVGVGQIWETNGAFDNVRVWAK